MTEHGYVAYTRGCRCDVCRAAKADYMRERRAAGRANARLHTVSATGRRGQHYNAWLPGATRYIAPLERHGTRAGYEEHGCRCVACTTARSLSDARYRTS